MISIYIRWRGSPNCWVAMRSGLTGDMRGCLQHSTVVYVMKESSCCAWCCWTVFSPSWLCVIVPLPKPSKPSFLYVLALAVWVRKGCVLFACVHFMFVCIYVCLCVTNSPDVKCLKLWYCSLLSDRLTRARILFSVDRDIYRSLDLTSQFLTSCLFFISSPPSCYAFRTTLESRLTLSEPPWKLSWLLSLPSLPRFHTVPSVPTTALCVCVCVYVWETEVLHSITYHEKSHPSLCFVFQVTIKVTYFPLFLSAGSWWRIRLQWSSVGLSMTWRNWSDCEYHLDFTVHGRNAFFSSFFFFT